MDGGGGGWVSTSQGEVQSTLYCSGRFSGYGLFSRQRLEWRFRAPIADNALLGVAVLIDGATKVVLSRRGTPRVRLL